MKIEDYRAVHSGRRILILGNGPSWKQQDLSRIDCPIIGLNQAWRMRECDYYCAADRDQFKWYNNAHGEVESWRPLFTTLRENDDRIMPTHAIKLEPHHVSTMKSITRSQNHHLKLGRYLPERTLEVSSHGVKIITRIEPNIARTPKNFASTMPPVTK